MSKFSYSKALKFFILKGLTIILWSTTKFYLLILFLFYIFFCSNFDFRRKSSTFFTSKFYYIKNLLYSTLILTVKCLVLYTYRLFISGFFFILFSKFLYSNFIQFMYNIRSFVLLSSFIFLFIIISNFSRLEMYSVAFLRNSWARKYIFKEIEIFISCKYHWCSEIYTRLNFNTSQLHLLFFQFLICLWI